MLSRWEKKLGLPPFDEALKIVTGPTGKRVDGLLDRLERISKDGASVQGAKELLTLVLELDKSGGLERLDRILSALPQGNDSAILLKEINKLIKAEGFQELLDILKKLLDRMDTFSEFLKVLKEPER